MTINYDDLEPEKPQIDYSLNENGEKKRLTSDQYKAVIRYLLCANHQLKEWEGLTNLKDRYEALRHEALAVFHSLSDKDTLSVSVRLANDGLELMMF